MLKNACRAAASFALNTFSPPPLLHPLSSAACRLEVYVVPPGSSTFCLQHSKKNPWRICITGLAPCTPCSLIQKISPPFLAPCLPFAQTKKGGWLKVMGCTRGPGINVNLNRRGMTRVCKTTFCEICRAYSMILRFGDVFPRLSG